MASSKFPRFFFVLQPIAPTVGKRFFSQTPTHPLTHSQLNDTYGTKGRCRTPPTHAKDAFFSPPKHVGTFATVLYSATQRNIGGVVFRRNPKLKQKFNRISFSSESARNGMGSRTLTCILVASVAYCLPEPCLAKENAPTHPHIACSEMSSGYRCRYAAWRFSGKLVALLHYSHRVWVYFELKVEFQSNVESCV